VGVKLGLSHCGKNTVFENRVLRGIFDPESEELAGGWRSLHNEELLNLLGCSNKENEIGRGM
jgi:hypothetical protein